MWLEWEGRPSDRRDPPMARGLSGDINPSFETDRQISWRLIPPTTDAAIPYFRLAAFSPRGSTYIFLTNSAVSFARGLSSPTWLVGPRPFASMSAILSARVPTNRWSGLTHTRLSHRWRTQPSPLQSGCANAYEMRWASVLGFGLSVWPPQRSTPYPLTRAVPVHSQQSSVLWTCAQKVSGVLGRLDMRVLHPFAWLEAASGVTARCHLVHAITSAQAP